MSVAVFIICCVLVMILAITLSGAIIYNGRRSECGRQTNPWCYSDWQCLNTDTGTPYPVNSVARMMGNCSPITAERAASLNADGKRNIYPGNVPACNPAQPDTCPQYMKGDVDWTTCQPAQGWNPR